ncbi:MAG: helix-turn-helix transcriptional regulator [Clostridia bacterium]|nr:helix-turn-helix transcriptional regulator [Clostridia bacterium]
MRNNQIFAANFHLSPSTVSLTNVYNTHVYGYYQNRLLDDQRDLHCLIITLVGQAKILLKNDQTIPLTEKTLFFGSISSVQTLQCNCPHWHFITYWFIPHNILLPDIGTFTVKTLDAEQEDAEATKIIQLLQTQMETKIQFANSYFCCRLLTYLDEINPFVQKSNALIEKIIAFINTHLTEELKVQRIAKEFGYCEKHIRYLFKTKLGISPKQYIHKTKLENVRQLLSTSDCSLQELAERYAFNSASHLSADFHREYGLSPSAFRKTCKTNGLPPKP